MLGAQVWATVRVRVLAEDGPRVWIAVSGRLARSTLPVLARTLREHADTGATCFFMDVTALADDRDEPGELLPAGARLAFHVIGARDDLRLQPGHDRRLFFHSGPSTAWTVWVSGPPPEGTKGRRTARSSAPPRNHRSSLGSIA